MVEDFGGFSTPETHKVNIWISGDSSIRDDVKIIMDDSEDWREATELLESYFEEQVEDLAPGLFTDLILQALGQVRWKELAAFWLSEMLGIDVEEEN